MKIRMRDGTGTREFKYVVEDADRHGNVRVYLWRKGLAKIRLRAKPGTPEFEAEYQRALKPAPKPTAKADATCAAGSLRWLVQLYYASAPYQNLNARTRYVRRRILDAICAKKGSKPFALMEPRHVAELRDEKAALPEAANAIVKALRQVFAWACDPQYRHADRNPARDVHYLRPNNPDGFHTWTIAEIEQYQERHKLGTKARLALDLLLYSGVRRSDVVKLGPQLIREGWLRFTEVKGRNRAPKHREIPVLPMLQASIAAFPSGHLTFLATAFGKPFTANGFGNWFKDRCVEAGLPHCTAHGLRKGGATIAADNGATEHQLMAIYGWESPKQAALYTRKANRKKLAGDAMPLIALEQKTDKRFPLSDAVRSGGNISGKR